MMVNTRETGHSLMAAIKGDHNHHHDSIDCHHNIDNDNHINVNDNDNDYKIKKREKEREREERKGSPLEVDFQLPDLHLCFEFQDAYHYTTVWYSHRTQQSIQQRDYVKRELIQNDKQDLIVIPCWWDGGLESLGSTINYHRPDLLASYNLFSPILLNPVSNFFPNYEIPTVGQLMLASFSESKFRATKEWWMGEKYDGIRCYWNPFSNTAHSRYGRYISLLPKLESQFPDLGIDCEFWCGRGQYDLVYSFLSSELPTQCDHLRIVAFDIAHCELQSKPFEERYSRLISAINPDHPLCEGHKHVKQIAHKIIEQGGEGVMLRKMNSQYENGRSMSLLKLKMTMGDKEAIVVAIKDDGALHLQLPNGKTFIVPKSDVFISKKLTIGDVVSFSYEESSRSDIPVRPKVFRIRNDISWDDLVHTELGLDKIRNFETKAVGYWTDSQVRAVLEEGAVSLGLDPLSPHHWYLHASDIFHHLSSKLKQSGTFQRFKGGYISAVQKVFPELKLDKAKFQGVWLESAARREFFVEYAKKHEFDPLVPDNWYLQTKIVSEKGAPGVLKHYKGRLSTALMTLFPEIGLLKSKFLKIDDWREPSARKAFFENYAKQKEFDPLNPENWYLQTYDNIMSARGGSRILQYYDGKIWKALMSLFPDIGFVKSKFTIFENWKDESSRRAFLENYAKLKGFDPLTPESWYSQTNDEILAEKRAASVLGYYDGKLWKALMSLFPEIGLDKSKFTIHENWKDESKRRAFFESYAKKKGFDALNPENWYSQTKANVLSEKGAGVLEYYDGKVWKALITLFPEIGLLKSNFKTIEKLKDVSNRRAFLENYAKQKGFDPLNPDNWYLQTKDNILSEKIGRTILGYYDGKLWKTFMSLFPDIGLVRSKFKLRDYWKEERNRRAFFENYANKKGFDPLIPDNWYSQTKDNIKSEKGAGVLEYYDGKVWKALMALFPEIGLLKSKFNTRAHAP